MCAVRLRRLARMMSRVLVVPLRRVRVVRSFFVGSGLMMFGRFLVMAGGVLVVLRGVTVMFCRFS
jgi:hypothetical protein